MCRLLVGVLLLVLFALAAAIVYLPWWGSVLVFVAVLLSIKPLGAWLLARLILAPLRLKSAVLRGADLLVNAVEPTAAPVHEQDDADDDEADVTPAAPLAWYWLDLTITPHLACGAKFTHWEPGDLSLAHPDAKPPSMKDKDEGPEDVGEVHEVQVWADGGFGPDEVGKYDGEQRVRLLACVQPEATVAKLRYYFEFVGEVSFPGMIDAG